jgi:glycosyltransferase involved in cell wall biosynthesis
MVASSPNVEFVGEIGDRDKADFLGNADALLFPIDWPEPFGLVMIEAMACGTPVIAFRRGSAPEVIDDGVSGFLVDDVPQAIAATRRIAQLDRSWVREVFERRFDIERAAREYVQIYRGLVRVRDGKRNGVKQSLIPRTQRGYRPILGQLGAEASNAAQVD